MMFFIVVSNPLYLEILKFGQFIPQTEIPESIKGTTTVPMRLVPKDPSQYNKVDKEKVSLDGCLQLIIGNTMDLDMFVTISN